MQVDNSLKSFKSKMEESLASLVKDLSTIRTGRAHTSMLNLIKVEVYGQLTPINQVGTVTVSDPQTLSIQVWDVNNVKFCEKALRESDLNLNPIIDGQILRIPVPKLSEEEEKNCQKSLINNLKKIKFQSEILEEMVWIF